MDRVGSGIIDLIEAAYDLELGDDEWLPTFLDRALPVLDQGLGVAGYGYARPAGGGPVELRDVHAASCPADFVERHMRALATTPPEVLREQVRPGCATTGSEENKNTPERLAHYTSHVPYCRDVLYITAVDPKGAGVAIFAPLPEVTKLTGRARERWQMFGAHVSAGHRLRRGLADPQASETGLPHHAEAVLDSKRFGIADATGEAQGSTAVERLRQAAIQIDRARGRLRESDPVKALEMWKALVQGRWSMVDWFDTDGRRFVLAVPNAPNITDPRGLTPRETQVVTYAIFGESNKMIAYRFGISRSRVSTLLSSAMQKLGVKTRAELIKKFRGLQGLDID